MDRKQSQSSMEKCINADRKSDYFYGKRICFPIEKVTKNLYKDNAFRHMSRLCLKRIMNISPLFFIRNTKTCGFAPIYKIIFVTL